MKSHLITPLLLALACTSLADEPANSLTRIPHTLHVPEFVPPPRPVPRPVPQMQVRASSTKTTADGGSISLLLGDASDFPDLPPAPEPKPRQFRPLTEEDEQRAAQFRRSQLHIAATIIDNRFSKIQWTHPDTGEQYEAALSLDVSLLEGIGLFLHEGRTYHLQLLSLPLSTNTLRRSSAQPLPLLPALPENAIAITRGDPHDPTGAAPATILRDIILAEHQRLVEFQSARRRHLQAKAAWRRENPQPPRHHSIWVRPHRNSRLLQPR